MAHPLRLALLDRLMSFGEQTAAQCAAAVGSTASNCSYHLRALARVGLVERGESADGREALALARDEELARRAFARHDSQPTEWRAAEAHNSYALRIAPSELAQLVGEIDRLVRPYIGLTRNEAPDDADVAYLRSLAFRHPEAG